MLLQTCEIIQQDAKGASAYPNPGAQTELSAARTFTNDISLPLVRDYWKAETIEFNICSAINNVGDLA